MTTLQNARLAHRDSYNPTVAARLTAKPISDARFTITREFCGYAKPRYILRFCGEWIASCSNKCNAEARRINKINARRAFLAQ